MSAMTPPARMSPVMTDVVIEDERVEFVLEAESWSAHDGLMQDRVFKPSKRD
jgi:hypothetical protein